jgi:GT2 family glycosyltransferase
MRIHVGQVHHPFTNPKINNMSPWLTIATVVKDDPHGFDATMHSISNQSDSDHQIVVIDSSTEPLSVGDESVDYSWTPAEGIYPAMNQALDRAIGKYILFLNAGDTLVSPDTLNEVRALLHGNPLWGFGLIQIADPSSGVTVISSGFDYLTEKRNHFARGKFPPHQATFAQVTALREIGGFDPTFTITADYAAMLKLSQLADPIYFPRVISQFSTGGISDTSWKSASDQFHRARLQLLQLRGTALVSEWLWTRYFRIKTGIYRASRRARR